MAEGRLKAELETGALLCLPLRERERRKCEKGDDAYGVCGEEGIETDKKGGREERMDRWDGDGGESRMVSQWGDRGRERDQVDGGEDRSERAWCVCARTHTCKLSS